MFMLMLAQFLQQPIPSGSHININAFKIQQSKKISISAKQSNHKLVTMVSNVHVSAINVL